MTEYREQENDLIYALDVGTRSVVGLVGRLENDRFKVLDMESAEHGNRAMLDGQIDNIEQVAGLVRIITSRLEGRLGVKLSRVCVAAAGRALRTLKGSFSMELPGTESVNEEQIGRLEAGAVTNAEESVQEDDAGERQFFLVGYAVAQYRLDNYPLNNLLHHNGEIAEVDVVATFLPGEVVESLYTTMRAAGLQVASLTLEPIAAMNAAIPAELRLLNLAMVDIGAGTTDIAVCRDGSVVGYTMATQAGDETTEVIMRRYLVDFATAERLKKGLESGAEQKFTDILGLEQTVDNEELKKVVSEPLNALAAEIARRIIELNGSAPSAVFLGGGGSRLSGLREQTALCLEMDASRVAIAGSNFAKSAWADDIDLNNPELTTPLGIAVSAGLGLLNDSYVIMLNGSPAKLFRSGVLTVQDILLMNGFNYADMLGRSGRNLTVTLDGRRMTFRGEPAAPAVLRVNGEDASVSSVVNAGDSIEFVPATSGKNAEKTLGELLGGEYSGRAMINNAAASLDTPLNNGDVVLTLDARNSSQTPAEPMTKPVENPVEEPVGRPEEKPADIPEKEPEIKPEIKPVPVEPLPIIHKEAPKLMPEEGRELSVFLNNKPLHLPAKKGGGRYYLMDLLDHSGIDFKDLNSPVELKINGEEAGFQREIKDGDSVIIRCTE